MNPFYQKNFLKLLDFTPAEISDLLALAAKLKAEKKAGTPHKLCTGKNVALIFEKTSTRTRCAFEVAAADLGMHPVYLDPSGSQIGKKESIADTARVLGRMFDGIEYRGFGQEIVEDLAKYAGVPVWNGLTNEFHPTQILADFLTIQEHFGELKGKIADVLRETRAGFNFGKVVLEGIGDYKGRSAYVEFQNENLTATVDGEILATTPDLISLVDTETFLPVTTDALKYGKRVMVVGLKCFHLWRTEKGIELVGPRYFGVDTDYIPLEERCKGGH